MAGRPPAKLELVDSNKGKKEDGRKTKLGVVWRSDFQGSYTVNLSFPHPTEVNSAGYPVEDDIVAVKTRSGAKYIIDRKKGFFINLLAYEAMQERPPYDGPGSNAAPAAEVNAEDFGDDDF